MFPSCLYLCHTSLQLKLWRNKTFQMRIKEPRNINISSERKLFYFKKPSLFKPVLPAEREGKVKERFPIEIRDGRIRLEE